MKRVKLNQGSHEWLAWRLNGITASDMSVIIGSNPYKTKMQLWEEKSGFKEPDAFNPMMQHGIINEPKIRDLVNALENKNYQPCCVEADNPIFRASLDGYDEESNSAIEIKCPVSEKILDNLENVPEYWITQMNFQAFVLGINCIQLHVYDFRKTDLFSRMFVFDKKSFKKLEEKALEFWKMIVEGKCPEPEKGDYIELDDPKLLNLLEQYFDIDEKEKLCKEQKKQLKDEIVEFGDDGNFKIGQYKVTRTSPRSSLDMERMKADGIDIDKYKVVKESIGSYRISKSKK